MFEIIFWASTAEGSMDRVWGIHYGSTWSAFFRHFDKGPAWKIVQFKLRRLLYDEIRRMDEYPNYKGARVLGICLNVMGLKPVSRKKGVYDREDGALNAALLRWVQKNFLRLREYNPEVMDACLIGGITFDEERSRLVKTYAKGLDREPHRDYLVLEPLPGGTPAKYHKAGMVASRGYVRKANWAARRT